MSIINSQNYYANQEYSDIQLVLKSYNNSECNHLWAHKIILASQSQYFNKLFNGPIESKKHVIHIIVPDIDASNDVIKSFYGFPLQITTTAHLMCMDFFNCTITENDVLQANPQDNDLHNYIYICKTRGFLTNFHVLTKLNEFDLQLFDQDLSTSIRNNKLCLSISDCNGLVNYYPYANYHNEIKFDKNLIIAHGSKYFIYQLRIDNASKIHIYNNATGNLAHEFVVGYDYDNYICIENDYVLYFTNNAIFVYKITDRVTLVKTFEILLNRATMGNADCIDLCICTSINDIMYIIVHKTLFIWNTTNDNTTIIKLNFNYNFSKDDDMFISENLLFIQKVEKQILYIIDFVSNKFIGIIDNNFEKLHSIHFDNNHNTLYLLGHTLFNNAYLCAWDFDTLQLQKSYIIPFYKNFTDLYIHDDKYIYLIGNKSIESCDIDNTSEKIVNPQLTILIEYELKNDITFAISV